MRLLSFFFFLSLRLSVFLSLFFFLSFSLLRFFCCSSSLESLGEETDFSEIEYSLCSFFVSCRFSFLLLCFFSFSASLFSFLLLRFFGSAELSDSFASLFFFLFFRGEEESVLDELSDSFSFSFFFLSFRFSFFPSLFLLLDASFVFLLFFLFSFFSGLLSFFDLCGLSEDNNSSLLRAEEEETGEGAGEGEEYDGDRERGERD